ncbi:MAG: pirin family protein [Cyclobacteriaceae bacterium]
MRTIQRIIDTVYVKMGPMTIGQPLPIQGLDQISPFLLLHHAGPIPVQAGKNPMHIGAHPHRGFEPITFVFNGSVEHHDSLGNHSVIKAGGVQWTTAGAGIVHSESAAPDFVAEGGTLEIIQLWINLPRELKLTPADYHGLQRDAIPSSNDDNVRVNVISGSYNDIEGPVKSLTSITAYTIELGATGKVDFQFPIDQNLLIYQLNGSTIINGETVTEKQLVYFKRDYSEVTVEAKTESVLLLVAGSPIDEPLAQYGPFVMNTQQEIMQAVEDYQTGKMGTLAS